MLKSEVSITPKNDQEAIPKDDAGQRDISVPSDDRDGYNPRQ